MSRKEKKQLKKDIKDFNNMNENELNTYMNMVNNDNQFIRKLTIGGPEGMRELMHKEIWRNIIEKYELSSNSNDFLNSLTEDELT